MSKSGAMFMDEIERIERAYYWGTINRTDAWDRLRVLFPAPDDLDEIENRLDAVEDQKRESGQFGVGA